MTLARRILAIALCAALLPLSACGGSAANTDQTAGSQETSRTYDNAEKVPPAAVQPPPPMLTRDPRTSVYSYLLWISYAYRILNSDVATHAFSPYEEVRVNSYVQLNKQEGKALDQVLIKLDFKSDPKITKDSTATVPAVETWKYRYISTKTGKYTSPWYDVSYDTTYTLVRDTTGAKWLVDHVEAKARGEVP